MSLLLLLFFSGAMSLFELERVSKDTEDILIASKENVDLAGDMLTALNEQNDMMITLAVASGRYDEIKHYSDRCEESMAQLSRATAVAQRKMQNTDTPEAADSLAYQVERVNQLTRAYIRGEVHLPIIQAREQGDTTALVVYTHKWYIDERGRLFHHVPDGAQRLHHVRHRNAPFPRFLQALPRGSHKKEQARFLYADRHNCGLLRSDPCWKHPWLGDWRLAGRHDEQEFLRSR